MLNLQKNALTVLERRYLTRGADGAVTESAEGLFHRVATAVALADVYSDPSADLEGTAAEFYELMTSLEFLPNSPTLMNAGKPLGQLSACFVLPVADSMEEIFEAVKQAALIHKSGGGTGFSFSRLRPAGANVATTGGVASGPVSFMRVFNMATEAVKQGGTRRGANMGLLRVDHPDILSFIDCKRQNADIQNFNISVGLTEAFMQAVLRDEEYDLIMPGKGTAVDRLPAREVYAKIVESAHRNGEPGIIFLDRLNRDNIVPKLGEIESTNPCGEQPLLPYESCNLGSINLALMVKDSPSGLAVDYERLGRAVRSAVHFLDNVIDVNKYPLDIIDRTTKQTRKIGLGVMGFADLLLQLGVPYNSDEGVELAGELMKFINETGRRASEKLAESRGAFPMFAESIYRGGAPLRNGTVTTIAPTGTISIIAGCSSGVEPVFAYAFQRNVMSGTVMTESNPILEAKLREAGVYSEELMRRVAEEGTIAHIEEIPEEIRRVFVCAHDISPEYHCRMQAAFQKHTDNAVSKTVNFPQSATIEDVRAVYDLAYELGCKGVTIYRDRSRDEQVLSIGRAEPAPSAADASIAPAGEAGETPAAPQRNLKPRPRPEITSGFTERMKIGCGNLYVTVNYDENGICEVFTSTGKAGGCPSQSEATARLASIALRCGVAPEEIITQLRGIRCPSTIRQSGMKCTSCPDAIAKVVQKVAGFANNGGDSAAAVQFAKEHAEAEGDSRPLPPPPRPGQLGNGRLCPECGSAVEHEGGCMVCRECGYSKCN